MRRGTPPYGLFEGVNFMTPIVLAYYKLRKGWAELSRGQGIDREVLYGVTIRPEKAGKSRLFFSRFDADAYIEELN